MLLPLATSKLTLQWLVFFLLLTIPVWSLTLGLFSVLLLFCLDLQLKSSYCRCLLCIYKPSACCLAITLVALSPMELHHQHHLQTTPITGVPQTMPITGVPAYSICTSTREWSHFHTSPLAIVTRHRVWKTRKGISICVLLTFSVHIVHVKLCHFFQPSY